MLEKSLANQFDQTFSMYQLWKPSERTAGWPDRGIQLHNSVMIWVELKMTTLRIDNKILVNNFEKEQAAFMFKWQRSMGFCFLLVGILDRKGNIDCYGIIRPTFYNGWLKVRQTLYTKLDLLFYTDEFDKVLLWFRSVYIRQDRYIRSK